MTELQPVSEALVSLETVIKRGLDTFREVGAALLAIRDAQLYRQRGYDRFEDYCESEFDLRRNRAYQLMEAAAVVESMSKILDTDPPAVESQARELARLPDSEARAEVWAEVQADATPGAPITAAKVREAVDRHPSAPPAKPKAAPVRAVPEPAADFPDVDDGAQWQCAGCNRWYGEDVSDCPEYQATFWPDEASAAAAAPLPRPATAGPAPAPFELPPAGLTDEQKAFYKIAGCVRLANLSPDAVAAAPDAALLGPSINELAGLADWLQRVVTALRARQVKPDLRAVK